VAALRVDVAYRVTSHLAIGTHAGIAVGQGLQYEYCAPGDCRPGDPFTYEFDYQAFELGLTAQLVFDRFWLAPWAGISKLSTKYDGDLSEAGNGTLGYGVASGYGVYRTEGGHYVDIYASATHSMKDSGDSFAPR
jgi:hypothetical protein